MKVRVEAVFPPVPSRRFDYAAYDEDTYALRPRSQTREQEMKAYEGDGRDLSTALDAVRVVRSQLAERPIMQFALRARATLDGATPVEVRGRCQSVGQAARYDVLHLSGTRVGQIDINVAEGRLS